MTGDASRTADGTSSFTMRTSAWERPFRLARVNVEIARRTLRAGFLGRVCPRLAARRITVDITYAVLSSLSLAPSGFSACRSMAGRNRRVFASGLSGRAVAPVGETAPGGGPVVGSTGDQSRFDNRPRSVSDWRADDAPQPDHADLLVRGSPGHTGLLSKRAACGMCR